MAVLESLTTNERFQLSPRHVIGRAPSCQLHLDDPRVSGLHAQLVWSGRGWQVQDLNSRNGTQVGIHELAGGERVTLERGSELILAGRLRFRLIDDSPPTSSATASDGETRHAIDGILTLPSDDEPELTIYRDMDGTWVAESDSESQRASEDEPVSAGGRSWQLTLPTVPPETRKIDGELRLHGFEYRFHASRDGEHIGLELVARERQLRLEARAHLELLWVLAKVRAQDMSAALPESECGWVMRSKLPRMLAVESHMINLWIHRARKQLASHGIHDAAMIIERRANATQLRIGVRRLQLDH